jgi:hypothetical protein
MAKKSVRKSSKFVKWSHKHPLYLVIAVVVGIVALIGVYKLVSIRDQVDELENMTNQVIYNAPLPHKVVASPAPNIQYNQ